MEFTRSSAAVAEDLAEDGVHDRVQPLVGEPVPVGLGLPHVDVAQAALRALDGHVEDQPLRWGVADAVGDALVRGGVDGDVLHEGIGHGSLA